MAGRKEAQQKEENKRDASRSRRSPARKDKSPARTKSPGRKSPSRATATKKATVSPSRRSPARKSPTKTPARKSPTRSPARKSPTRNVRGVEVLKSVQSTVTATKKEYITSLDSDSDTPDFLPEAKEKPKIAVRGRSRNADIDRDSLKGLNNFIREAKLESDPLKTFSTVLRRSSRRSADVDRVVRVTQYDVQAQKLTEFSDDDEVALRKAEGEARDESNRLVEFGGTIGAAFFIAFLPIFVYGIHIFCNEKNCSFTQVPDWKQYTNVFTFFDLQATMTYYGCLLIVGMLSVLPIGGKKVSGLANRHEKLEYVANAPFSFFVLFLAAVLLEVFGIGAAKFINRNYFHFILPAFVFGVLLAFYSYFKSFYAPVTARTLNSSLYVKKLYNFFMGREINPRAMGVLDLKIFSLRAAIFGALLFSSACFYQSLKFSTNKEPLTTIYGVNITLPVLDPTMTTLYTLTFVYYLDSILFEPEFLSSFEIQYEGFGYLSAVGYALYPFFLSSLVRYVYYNGIQLGTLKLITSTITFLLGYILYRGSNSQKNAFRRNPYHPSVAHLETLSTSQARKLIVSSFWGIVRKPNYLGDILMHLSLVPFVYNVPPVLFLIFTVVLLVHRTARDNMHCNLKYGGSWQRYCTKVKHVLLPKVY